MRDKTATFIGHKDCYGVQEEVVRSYIIELIESGVTEFLCGGMGSFDWMCARIVYKLKKQYPQVRSFLVIPYLTFNVLDREYFDDVIYPEGFEKYHFKAAIPARNKYMIENSAYAVCYVDHGWGGAAQTYAKAITWVAAGTISSALPSFGLLFTGQALTQRVHPIQSAGDTAIVNL